MKLKLDNLAVKSFVTGKKEEIRGGLPTLYTGCFPTLVKTMPCCL